jgi:hypothetical protein
MRRGPDDEDYLFRLDSGHTWYPRAWLRHDDGRADGSPDDWPDDEPDMPSDARRRTADDAATSAARGDFLQPGLRWTAGRRHLPTWWHADASGLARRRVSGRRSGRGPCLALLLAANTGTNHLRFKHPGQRLIVTSSTGAGTDARAPARRRNGGRLSCGEKREGRQ